MDIESFVLMVMPGLPSAIMLTIVYVQDWRERKEKQP